jgi:hypothetical protein
VQISCDIYGIYTHIVTYIGVCGYSFGAPETGLAGDQSIKSIISAGKRNQNQYHISHRHITSHHSEKKLFTRNLIPLASISSLDSSPSAVPYIDVHPRNQASNRRSDFYTPFPAPLAIFSPLLFLRLRLPGLGSPRLLRWGLLLGSLGIAQGGRAGNGRGAQVGAVSGLGGRGGDGLVGSAERISM